MTSEITLVSDDGTREVVQWEAGRSLAKEMFGYLRDLLEARGMAFRDIKGVGVFRGPGSYTGLRIALTVLNTFAAAQQVPIVGAVGDAWSDDCLARLTAGEDDKVVLPEYGADAHITKPRK